MVIERHTYVTIAMPTLKNANNAFPLSNAVHENLPQSRLPKQINRWHRIWIKHKRIWKKWNIDLNSVCFIYELLSLGSLTPGYLPAKYILAKLAHSNNLIPIQETTSSKSANTTRQSIKTSLHLSLCRIRVLKVHIASMYLRTSY